MEKKHEPYYYFFSKITILNILHGYFTDLLVDNGKMASIMNLSSIPNEIFANGIRPNWVISFAILSGSFVAPVTEELVSRAFIFKYISKKNIIAAYIISSFIFGILHVDIESSFLTYEIILSVFKVFSGLILARSYAKMESIIHPILIHMISNFILLLPLVLFFQY